MGRAQQKAVKTDSVCPRRADALFAEVLPRRRGLSSTQRRERARALARTVIPARLEQLREIGLVEAEALPSGETGYRVSARGLRYCEVTGDGDPVVILLERLMRATLAAAGTLPPAC